MNVAEDDHGHVWHRRCLEERERKARWLRRNRSARNVEQLEHERDALRKLIAAAERHG